MNKIDSFNKYPMPYEVFEEHFDKYTDILSDMHNNGKIDWVKYDRLNQKIWQWFRLAEIRRLN